MPLQPPTRENIDGMQQRHPSVPSPPGPAALPPGFFQSAPSVSPGLPPGHVAPGPASGSSVESPLGSLSNYDRGVAFRVADGVVSAPPPPGFGAAPDQRDGTRRLDAVRGLLGETSVIPANGQRQETLLRPSAIAGTPEERFTAAQVEVPSSGMRTSSFANLAAALGEGLAESMDNSLQKQRQQQEQVGAYPSSVRITTTQQQRKPSQPRDHHVTREDLFGTDQPPPSNRTSGQRAGNGREMDNFARQSRHTASRLVGSSTSADMGYDLRFSSATGTAVVPARMLSRDRVGPSSTGKDTEGPAPAMATTPTLIAPLRCSQEMPAQAYGGSSDSTDQSLIGRTPVGVTVVEPGSRTNSPHLPNLMTTLNVRRTILSPSTGTDDIDKKGVVPGNNLHSQGGRSSAPPQVFEDGPMSSGSTTSAALRAQTAVSLQHHAADLRELGRHMREKQQSPSEENLRSSPALANLAPTSVRPSYASTYPLPQTAHLDYGMMDRAEEELSRFLWEVADGGGSDMGTPSSSRTPSPTNKTSRGLAILHAAHLFIPDVRSTCEAFGALMSFRPEFSQSRGVIFISYHDLRSARYAAVELRSCLMRLATPRGTATDTQHDDVEVRYCVPLNASSANDESIVVVSNTPRNFNEKSLEVAMSSYGAVRGVRYDALDEYSKEQSYIVDFYDVQDARQALLELESTQPWGIEVSVTVGIRQPIQRKQGQELLALIGRWRQEEQRSEPSANIALAPGTSPSPLPLSEASTRAAAPKSATPESSVSTSPKPTGPDGSATEGAAPASGVFSHVQGVVQPTTQLVVGPDGQYSYIVVNQPSHHVMAPHHNHHQPGQTVIGAHHPVQQQIIHGPHGAYVASFPAQVPSYHGQPQYVVHHHPHPHVTPMPQYHHFPGGTVISASPYGYPGTVPVYAPVAAPCAQADSSVSSGSSGGMYFQGINNVSGNAPSKGRGGSRTNGSAAHRSNNGQTTSRSGEEDTAQLGLDIDAVDTGKDTRTSLMVRNIPNKYTQHMLLGEFDEGGHGSNKIDFFYLPIDFKNKCNRGYAFVNFVDYRDIVTFFHRYNGKPWKVFNSDKICQITYARIQGKAAMLKRFQNSALMEKDDEYKPLVFVSHGADKGNREEFPSSAHPQSPSLSSFGEAAAPKRQDTS